MTKKEVKAQKVYCEPENLPKKAKCDFKGGKSPWVSEQDRLEAMASAFGHEMDRLANDLGCE